MIWLLLAFTSAALLGFYDVFKKQALNGNAVLPVLFLNTFFCSLIFLPFILLSAYGTCLDGSMFYVPVVGWEVHKYILMKSLIVLASWLGERLNVYQWIGVGLAIVSYIMLSRTSKKEGIDFKHNKWIFAIVGAAIFGAISGLYDKYLMAPVSNGGVGLNKMDVQSWYNIYQCFIMGAMVMILWWPTHKKTTPFHWSWSIILVSVFLSVADFVYFYALSIDGAMISIVSMVRRASVIVSFLFGAVMFHEKNLKSKFVDLFLVLLGLVFLWLGSMYK